MRYLALFCYFLFSVAIVSSCGNDDGGSASDGFDRKGMLQNIGNEIIIPDYHNFNNLAADLHIKVQEFHAAPTNATLSAVQAAFVEAYKGWQKISVYELGPAAEPGVMLRMRINIFPTDTVQINSNISSGTYNLEDLGNADAKGLPAIDYLLYGTGADAAAILDKYTNDGLAANRKAYLLAVSEEIKNMAAQVYNAWIPSGGNYINTFIEASGTDIGSSIGQLVNQFNYDFELIKNPKIGIPLGKKTFDEPLPAKVEAYYSGISVELATLNLQALKNLFLGGAGLGFDDYLNFLGASHSGQPLSVVIANQFDVDIQKVQVIPDPLSASILNNTALVNDAYTELQKTVVLIKTDMPSALGVLITYQDNDGD